MSALKQRSAKKPGNMWSVAAVALTLCAALVFFSQSSAPQETFTDELPELPILRQAYPDVGFETVFDPEKADWKITVASGGKSTVLYRAGGRYLSPELLSNIEGYRQLIYRFPAALADPADFTVERIERISHFGATENRRVAPVSSTAFVDAVFDSATQAAVDAHIVSTSFLGQSLSAHEGVVGALGRVQARIIGLSGTDPVVAEFVRTLGSAEGYYWRQIRDTSGRSFHSMGLAIDLLPRLWERKVVYWLWEKNKGNDRWMLIPLANRWMPPVEVVDAFEAEGFIWGGKWALWDNMHFEYRPELIAGRVLFE